MTAVITVEHLSKRYGDVEAVKEISFSVNKGEIFGIIGPNGAGKTTTIEILEGLRKRDKGTVDVLGYDPEKSRRQLNERIGVQYQSTSIQKKMKVKEAIDLFSSFYAHTTGKDKIVEILGLHEKLNNYYEDLSGGWKQRVTLALATLHQPEIVFLDEPSMGLDPYARRELWTIIRLLRDHGSTVVVTTHYMEEAEKLCDRVAMIYGGQLKALDQPRYLLEKLAVNYIILQSENMDISQITGLSGVLKVEQDGVIYKIYSDTLQETAYHLFNMFHLQNIHIQDFKFERGSLDDLFVHILEKEVGA
jgi:ABC-2 type transport system ATP-binding protein